MNEPTLLFQDIDQVYSTSEKVRDLTSKLGEDLTVPADYKVHMVKNVAYVNELGGKMKVGEAWKISYDILSELMGRAVGITCVEPVLII